MKKILKTAFENVSKTNYIALVSGHLKGYWVQSKSKILKSQGIIFYWTTRILSDLFLQDMEPGASSACNNEPHSSFQKSNEEELGSGIYINITAL